MIKPFQSLQMHKRFKKIKKNLIATIKKVLAFEFS